MIKTKPDFFPTIWKIKFALPEQIPLISKEGAACGVKTKSIKNPSLQKNKNACIEKTITMKMKPDVFPTFKIQMSILTGF